MTTPSEIGSRRRRALKSIGLWGAPGSGKTTFLAALYIAATRSPLDLNIIGVDDESTEFLIENNHLLANDHRFPNPTQVVSSYSWTVNINAVGPDPGYAPPGEPRRASAGPIQFGIDLRDAPGGVHSSQPMAPPSRLDLGDGVTPGGWSTPGPGQERENMTDYLARCDGLLLLIDPTREQEPGDVDDYFQGALLRMAQRRLTRNQDTRLPHYVAVCITKFDHPQVYNFARKYNYRTLDGHDEFPRVHDGDAEEFFRDLCGNSDMSDANLVCNAMRRYFRPERVQYFVTSAIGFYRQDRFREDDYQNVEDRSDGSARIRGRVYPINVLEPMLWLGQRITAG